MTLHKHRCPLCHTIATLPPHSYPTCCGVPMEVVAVLEAPEPVCRVERVGLWETDAATLEERRSLSAELAKNSTGRCCLPRGAGRRRPPTRSGLCQTHCRTARTPRNYGGGVAMNTPEKRQAARERLAEYRRTGIGDPLTDLEAALDMLDEVAVLYHDLQSRLEREEEAFRNADALLKQREDLLFRVKTALEQECINCDQFSFWAELKQQVESSERLRELFEGPRETA